MAVKCVDELLVFQKAVDAANAISALTERPSLCKDFNLRDQLRASSASIPSHVAEGFGQKTDRHFAHYLYIARGSTQEVRVHLTIARGRGHLGEGEWRDLCERYDELARMLTGLIRHLETEDRKRRG